MNKMKTQKDSLFAQIEYPLAFKNSGIFYKVHPN